MRTEYVQDIRSPVRIGVLFLTLFLAACVSQGINEPDAARFQPTKEEQVELIAYAHANAISEYCTSNPRFLMKHSEYERVLGGTFERAKAAGVRVQYEYAVLMGISKTDAAKIGDAYRAERGIDPGKGESWCEAGRYEIRNKTRIGKYIYEYEYK
jgi:hypothetical protein